MSQKLHSLVASQMTFRLFRLFSTKSFQGQHYYIEQVKMDFQPLSFTKNVMAIKIH
jgi:hypothetical protein